MGRRRGPTGGLRRHHVGQPPQRRPGADCRQRWQRGVGARGSGPSRSWSIAGRHPQGGRHGRNGRPRAHRRQGARGLPRDRRRQSTTSTTAVRGGCERDPGAACDRGASDVEEVLQLDGRPPAQGGGSARSRASRRTRGTLRAGRCFVALAGSGSTATTSSTRRRRGAAAWSSPGAARAGASTECGVIVAWMRPAAASSRSREGYRRDFRHPGGRRDRQQRQDDHQGDGGGGPLGSWRGRRRREKNYNNEIGVPHDAPWHRGPPQGAAVVEMGMRGRGRSPTWRAIARPTVGVVTNVGPVHMEYFGSVEEWRRPKAELVEALPTDGYGDPQRRRPPGSGDGALGARPVVTFGLDLRADVERRADGALGTGRHGPFTLGVAGRSGAVCGCRPRPPPVHNALAAAAGRLVLGVDSSPRCEGFASFRPGNCAWSS